MCCVALVDRSHTRDDISGIEAFWVTGRRSTSPDPFQNSGDRTKLCIFCVTASRSDVISLVDTIGVLLGSRKKHFFADTEVAVSVAWLHDFAFFEYLPFHIRCRAEVL